MNAYSEPEPRLPGVDPPSLMLESVDIDRLFRRAPGWFSRDRVRKRLYRRGFPLAVEKGRWLRSAVLAWIEREGSRPAATPRNRRRGGAPSGYAQP